MRLIIWLRKRNFQIEVFICETADYKFVYFRIERSRNFFFNTAKFNEIKMFISGNIKFELIYLPLYLNNNSGEFLFDFFFYLFRIRSLNSNRLFPNCLACDIKEFYNFIELNKRIKNEKEI